MIRLAWKVQVGIGLVGLTAAASLAFAGGMPLDGIGHLLLYSGVAVLGSGALSVVLMRALWRRGITVQVIVAALAPVIAVGIAVAWAASAMFLMTRDALILSVTLVAASTLAVILAILLGQSVVRASRDLAVMARRLAEPDARASRDGAPGAPGELMTLALELELTSARLEEARFRVEETERTRRELIAWVSHDLRTPLAGIRAMAEALEDDIVVDPETVARYHSTIQLETKRLGDLVDDLFEFSRIQAGALRLSTEWVPLDELVADVVNASRPAGGSIELVICTHADAPTVQMSPPEIVRVLRNLVDNALRHTSDGGRVVVEAGAGDDDAWISVSDGCGGIPQAELGRLFEPGWRGTRPARQETEAVAWA